MPQNNEISLREYLHLMTKRVKDPPCIDEYDAFLIEIWDFFALRVAAERYFESHRHVAVSRRGALPVSWRLLRETWNSGGPPEQTITLIAKRNYNDVNSLISNLRKVLVRVRQKVALGSVQQLDSHCLRWLTRQPGRTAAEKGGSKQEILGVVRVENFNTLENRVFKDFLSRCLALATMYLRKYDTKKWHEHVNIKAVSRLKNLCIAGMAIPEFEKVADLREFPQPNYVLQQDRLYSKIWSSYCAILREEDVAEKLWDRRDEIDGLYSKCMKEMDEQCSPRAKYDTPLWICELDGKNDIFENPIWGNELCERDIVEPAPPTGGTQIIDFTYPWDGRDVLVYPSAHRNARPFIQNPHHPSKEPGEKLSVAEILRMKDAVKLGDYFRQLHGLLGGKRWIILTPDDWDANWLEAVKRARPSALPRENAFLLWRSVAAALGLMERREFRNGASLIVADGHRVPFYNAVELRFMEEKGSRRILPQRSSVRLHASEAKNCQDVRFHLGRSFSDQKSVYELGSTNSCRIGSGLLSPENFVQDSDAFVYSRSDDLLREGVLRFLREEAKGLVSYFDELDALSLVIQNRAEEVEFKTLVEHNECSPGGKPYCGKMTKGGALLAGSINVSLNLLEGELEDNAPLKTLEQGLEEKAPEDQEIYFQAEMTPGQGLAIVTVSADFLEKPLPLDLSKMEDKGLTKARIEREMKRHFPPVMPLVEACEAIWKGVPARHHCTVAQSVFAYLNEGKMLPPDTFAQAQPYWGVVGAVDASGNVSYRRFGESRFFDEKTMSPVDKLKRENVFGNSPAHRVPNNANIDWGSLFARLANDYKAGKSVLRLIAWSYQYDASCFEFMRESFYNRYVKWSGDLETMEITFCANNFPSNDVRLTRLLREVISRISTGRYKQEELRLAYNLMQFHPEAMEDQSSEICENAMNRLAYDYNHYQFWRYETWGGGGSTKAAGYYLKCMLFLLHRRRFDPVFLQRSEQWSPRGFLGEKLPTHTDSLRNHERTRIAFINYVRGHGSIDGIPMGD